MKKNYTEPVKNYRGLWEVEVTNAATGYQHELRRFTTKAAATKWVKAEKKEGNK